MSGNTFVSNRLDIIESRFEEINQLLDLACANSSNSEIYKTLCRSAHILLVSHFEGIYKDITKDVIADLNRSTNFNSLKKQIFYTHAQHFISAKEDEKIKQSLKLRLWEAFKDYDSNLILEPILRVENKNPTPKILEEILKKFGEKDFFKALINSRLEIVFENNQKASLRELRSIKNYLFKGVLDFPFTVDKNYFYNFESLSLNRETTSLFEEFLNDFLNDRHKIVHGQTLNSPKNDTEIADCKIKMEILIYAFIIVICHASNPTIHLL